MALMAFTARFWLDGRNNENSRTLGRFNSMADTTVSSGLAASRKPVFSDSYKNVVLGLLVLAYTLNFIDRTIISTIGQAIKVDLKLTDTQLGLLGGFSFAILYTLLGIPLARFAERWNRVSIISGALIIWSGFTALCGFAGSFVQLLIFRVGVGVGEAGCSPPAHSLISDYFEPKKRATALSIYSFGIPLGTMFGAALGGWLAKTFGWRVAFMAVGAPGIIVALLVKFIVKEPPRGHSELREAPVLPDDVTAEAVETPKGFGLWGELKEIGRVSKSLFLCWPVANMVLGVTLVSFAGYGAGQFIPPYFIRTFGLDYAVVGLIVGLLAGFSNGIGTLVGGFLTDWVSKRSARWYALVPAIGVAISVPIYIFAYTLPDWKSAALVLLLPGIFAYTYLGPTFGVVQNVVETHQRATATALLFFVLNLIALGFGPPFIGWLIDQFAQFHFTNPGQYGVFATLAQTFGGAAHGAVKFAAACPGGAAPKGAALAAAAACKTALITSTRQGVIVAYWFSGWGAFHYFLGSFGLAKELKRVEVARAA
jgi:MFS family permease